MRISHKHKFVFLSKWKCASESIRMALNDYTDISSTQEYPFYHHTGARDLKRHFDEEGWKWDEYYSFVTVRNPWNMLVSLYYYGLPDSKGKYYWDRHWDEIVKDVYNPRQRIVPDDIIEFNRWIETYDLTRFTLDAFINDEDGKCLVSDVYPIEKLNRSIKKMNRKLALPDPIKIPFINKTKHPRGEALYNAKRVDRVAEIFASDVKAGGYKRPKVKGKVPQLFTKVKKHSVCTLFLSEREVMLKAYGEKQTHHENASQARGAAEQTIDKLREELERLQGVSGRAEKAEKKLEETRKELAAFDEDVLKKAELHDKTLKDHAETKELLDRIRGMSNQFRSESIQFKRELDITRKELQKEKEVRATLETELKETKSELGALSMSYERAESIIARFQDDLEAERAHVDELNARKAALRKEIAGLHAKLEYKRNEHEETGKSLWKARKWCRMLESKVGDLEGQLEEVSKELRDVRLERRNLAISMHMWDAKARKGLLTRWFAPKQQLPKVR